MIHEIPGYLIVDTITGTIDFNRRNPSENENHLGLRITGLPEVPNDFQTVMVELDDGGDSYAVSSI